MNKPRSKTPLILGIILAVVGVVVAFTLGFFTGASSVTATTGIDADGEAETASIFDVDEGPDSPSMSSVNVAGGKGDAVDSDGIRLTVTNIEEGPSIDYLEEGVRAEHAATESLDAVEGGKLVTVTTEVENTGTEAWDLTCGFAIQSELVDDQGRHFQPIDSLYRIPGNPGCNEQTNPGFTKTMKWAFEVPETAKGFKLGFADPTVNYDKLTYVELD
ncbi:hypothetical protein [Corynebacterium freneyi]|uniref:DUF4352 domain-containing protein n=1 Tax=Corynebacterium freneyi TaxID=134034 RepID=A0ABS4U9E8_9CORY|nr:hypothetical protein [Corynebacterium freneyi]MBP2333158.1 hypothetical protein [Corynebacterium freneyi]QXA52760.1 DUF4352 domain-containing protein [Corynebacterium freneyi]